MGLARASPQTFRALAAGRGERAALTEAARRVLMAAHEVALSDPEAAIACFRSAPQALAETGVEQFEEWAREGLRAGAAHSPRARRSY